MTTKDYQNQRILVTIRDYQRLSETTKGYQRLQETISRSSSGGLAGTVLAGPLFELLTVLLAINHYKTTD